MPGDCKEVLTQITFNNGCNLRRVRKGIHAGDVGEWAAADFPSLCSWPGLPTSYLLSHQQCLEMRPRRLPAPAHNMPKDTKNCWFYALKSSGIFLSNPISTNSRFRSLSLYWDYHKFISYFQSCQFQFHYAYREWVPVLDTTDKYLRLLRILHFYCSICY